MAATSPQDLHQLPSSKSRPASPTRRFLTAITLACIAAGFGGCSEAQTVAKNLGDYLNLRNSFLTPSEVGRFDKAAPWGNARPVKWPILDQLDVIDAPANEWEAATDPTPADVMSEVKEFTLGPGDLVRISVYDLQEPGREWFKEQQISETGTVDILYLGSVRIAGLTTTQANEKIGQEGIAKHVLLPPGNGSPGPQVSVTLLQSRGRIFSILGLDTVGRPGTYNIIGSNFRVLDALALAGDLRMQPGLDYLYIIRPTQTEAPPPVMPPSSMGTPDTSGTMTPPSNPLETIEGIERTTTIPAPTPPATSPAPTPPAATLPGPSSSAAPVYLRPLPATITADAAKPGIGQSDLDAAISGGTPPASATNAATTAGTTATKPAGNGDNLLEQAIDPSSGKKSGNYVFIGGKWVLVPATTNPASTTGTTGTTALPPADAATAANPGAVAPGTVASPAPGAVATSPEMMPPNLRTQRVIRIPIAALRSGDPRYNILIKPGDVINVPSVETGEFYVMGHVNRPGVFALTGRKITMKMAIAAAGNLDQLAIPRRCELIRRIGTNQEAIVYVNLQSIFDGSQPDIFLKPNDLINVGTDMIAPFLAVTRNAYRLSYGFGFVYDRNYYIQPQGAIQQN
jgi:protein involved in polysaccharide export with SLBB domain